MKKLNYELISKRNICKRGMALVLSLCLGLLLVTGCGEQQVTEEPSIEWETVEEVVEPEELYQTVKEGSPELVGMNEDILDFIDMLMETEMDYGFSGAQLVVVKDGLMVVDRAYGVTNGYIAPTVDENGNVISDAVISKNSAAVTTDTLFDLASNSKMFATNFAIQKLVNDGLLDINKKVCEYIPEFVDREGEDQILGKTEMTVKDLLCHQAGFPADPCYHNPEAPIIKSYPDLYCHDRSQMLQKIIDTPLKYEPRKDTEYSDVDYMLLGILVEQITGKGLEDYCKEEFYDKMGLTHVTYNPLQNGFTKDDCAATELNGNTRQGKVTFDDIRTETLQGEVHDEKAYYCMNGVSGHAGLFSNAEDLAKLCQVMLNGGGYGNEAFFSQEIIDEFTAAKNRNDPDWGLGWWRKDNNDTSIRLNYFGVESGDGTFGHTGWTGTITSIDPENNLIIVYLTNCKNTPVIDKNVNPNDFVGNNVSAGCLGLVNQLIYEAYTTDNEASFDSLLISMVNERIKSLDSHYGKYDEWPHVMDTIEWEDVLLKWANKRCSNELKEAGISSSNELLDRVRANATFGKSLNMAEEKLPVIIDGFNALAGSDREVTYGDFKITAGSKSDVLGPRKEVSFPSHLGASSISNMVMQSLYGFEGHAGEGQLYLTVLDRDKASGLRVFINGFELDCTDLLNNPGVAYVIDFSSVAKDGVNTIQVTGLDINVESQTAVNVIIPVA